MEERIVILTNIAGKKYGGKNPQPLPHSKHKNQSEVDLRPKLKAKTMKLLKENNFHHPHVHIQHFKVFRIFLHH